MFGHCLQAQLDAAVYKGLLLGGQQILDLGSVAKVDISSLFILWERIAFIQLSPPRLPPQSCLMVKSNTRKELAFFSECLPQFFKN